MRLVLTWPYAFCILAGMDKLEIIALRRKNGWSQSDLASRLGVDQATVSRLERGAKVSGPIARLLRTMADPKVGAGTVKRGNASRSIQGQAAQ